MDDTVVPMSSEVRAIPIERIERNHAIEQMVAGRWIDWRRILKFAEAVIPTSLEVEVQVARHLLEAGVA
jgi:hypothetical protein